MDIIDVSKYQKDIDWLKVPYESVIIRIGFRGFSNGKISIDPYAKKNLAGARATKKKIGIYFMSQAVTIEEAREEADFACDQAGKIDLPVYIDSETGDTKNHNGRADHLSKEARTVVTVAFCTRVLERGYKAGVYAGQYWFRNNLDYSKLSSYHIWVARYSIDKPSYPPKWEFWQYTSKGSCPGINGNVDLSRAYDDQGEIPLQKTVLIAQASKGETGLANQRPGNQNGRELNIREYYKHVKEWRAFRAPTPKAQNAICFAALRGVKNACIGYDQNVNDRNTLFEAAQLYGYDPGEVKVDVECDCSSYARVCCAYAGYILPDFNTASEAITLKKAGFKEVDFDQTTGSGLQIGDILVTKTKGHTCIIVQA